MITVENLTGYPVEIYQPGKTVTGSDTKGHWKKTDIVKAWVEGNGEIIFETKDSVCTQFSLESCMYMQEFAMSDRGASWAFLGDDKSPEPEEQDKIWLNSIL